MTREERAKQFAPFDAMKGLQEALRDREERHSRVERREISEDAVRQNSLVLARLKKGSRVMLDYYHAFHEITREGIITELSFSFQYLRLDEEKIFFDDIYEIMLV